MTDWSKILFDKNKGLIPRRVKVQGHIPGQGNACILLTFKRYNVACDFFKYPF